MEDALFLLRPKRPCTAAAPQSPQQHHPSGGSGGGGNGNGNGNDNGGNGNGNGNGNDNDNGNGSSRYNIEHTWIAQSRYNIEHTWIAQTQISRNHQNDSLPPPQPPQQDVFLLVGSRRLPYRISSHTLSLRSHYFHSLFLSHPLPTATSPLTIDCEESVFDSLLTLLRYPTFRALPNNLPPDHLFKLHQELHFYGISVSDSPADPSHPSFSSSSTLSHSSIPSSKTHHNSCSSPPLAFSSSAPPPLFPTYDLAVDLPDLAVELTEPARLVLVSSIDPCRAAFFSCKHCLRWSDPEIRSSSCRTSAAALMTQWAVNFHHRHAFCTSCGNPPLDMAPRHFAELFMVAAAYFSVEDYSAAASPPSSPLSSKWRISADSTCILKFLENPALPCSRCAQTVNGYEEDRQQYQHRLSTNNRGGAQSTTVWAANCFYSHAFCTRCGNCAEGQILASLLLTLRYGGGRRNKLSRRCSNSSSSSSTRSF